MSVNVGLSLVEAFSALTGVEYVARAGELMVKGTGAFSGISLQSAAQILQANGAVYTGGGITINPATIEAGRITGYQALNSTWNISGAGFATPAQLSNGMRAALQNAGSQIGSTALQPVTDVAVQSTGTGNVLQVTSKGALAKIGFEAALYSAAAALGVTLGVGIVETNPKFVTSVYNKLFNDNVNPEEIASIVENTTVWQNIRDGVTFLTEDFLEAVKGGISEVVVTTSSARQDGVFPESVDGVFTNLGGYSQLLGNYQVDVEHEFMRCTSSTGSERYIRARWLSYSVFPKSSGYGVRGTGGFVTFVPAGVAYNKGNNVYAYPEDNRNIDRIYTNIQDTANNESTNLLTYPFVRSTGDAPAYIEHRADNDGSSAASVRSNIQPALLDWLKNRVIPEVVPSDGISDKPGAVKPVTGHTLAEDYPDWDNNSIETVDGWDSDNDTIKKRKWYPVALNVDQSTGQNSAQDGTMTEDDMSESVNNIDNAIEENRDNNPDTETQTSAYPNPNPAPGTDLYPVTPNPPDIDASDGEDPDPTIPILTTVATSGLAHIYNPTLGEVRSLGAALWTPSLIENIKKIFVNPMDGIIGFHILYATPKTGTAEEIVLGYYGTGVQSKVVTNQYVEVDCGYVAVDEWWNDARDYEPYVNVSLYLPFIGIVPLKANDVIGSHVKVKYHVDVLTGTCLAMVDIQKYNARGTLYQFVGNCAITIPLSSGNYTAVITSLLSVASSAVGGAAIGGVGGALFGAFKGAAINAGRAKLQVIQSGNLGANAGAMGIRNPFLIIRRPVTKDAYAYNMQYGYPAFKWVTLGQVKGFTRVKSVHLNDVKCTDEEKDMIEAALKEGVIL